MKTVTVFAVAGLVAAGLASAIPTHGHDQFHKKKRDAAAPVIETVTTIFYQTVVWVDGNGAPVSTEINTPPSGVPTTLLETLASGEVPSAATPADLGAVRRPSGQRPPFGPPSSVAAPKPSSEPNKYTPAPAPAPAQSHTNEPVPQNTPAAQNGPTSGSLGGSSGNQNSAAVPGGMGICYDMIDSSTKCKASGTINSEFGFLKSKGFGTVRVYDIGCPVGDFIAAAAQNGMKIMIGINSINNYDGDLNKLIGMVNGNWGPVDTVYICNECVNSGSASAGAVAGKVAAAKQTLQSKGYSGNVVTVDTFNTMMNDATICSTSDYCATNIHAFFDPNTSADTAASFVHNMYNKVVSTSNGKRVVITESGWPWKGSCNGKACPSVDNQVTAMNGIMGQFSGQASNLFLFQGYNAGYKPGGQFGVEPYFGIFDTDHYDGRIS